MAMAWAVSAAAGGAQKTANAAHKAAPALAADAANALLTMCIGERDIELIRTWKLGQFSTAS